MTLVKVYAGQRSVEVDQQKCFLYHLVILYKGPINCHDVNYT